MDLFNVLLLQIIALILPGVAVASTGFSGASYHRYKYYYTGSRYSYYYYSASSYASYPVGVAGVIIGCVFTGIIIALVCYTCHAASKKNRRNEQVAQLAASNAAVAYTANPEQAETYMKSVGADGMGLAEGPPRYSTVIPVSSEEPPRYTESNDDGAVGITLERNVKTHDKAILVENED